MEKKQTTKLLKTRVEPKHLAYGLMICTCTLDLSLYARERKKKWAFDQGRRVVMDCIYTTQADVYECVSMYVGRQAGGGTKKQKHLN